MRATGADVDAGFDHLFWYKCCSCGLYFTKERGWIRPGIYRNPLYLCSICGPTQEIASTVFDQVSMRLQNDIQEFWPEGK